MYNFLKSTIVSIAGWIWSVFGPALPVAAACTAMVLADVWSARRLAGRLGRSGNADKNALNFNSARFGRTVRTLAKIYAVIALAALVENLVVGEWIHLVKLAGGIICFWQLVSILENEASSNPHPWARVIGRFLVDKTSRYIKNGELHF